VTLIYDRGKQKEVQHCLADFKSDNLYEIRLLTISSSCEYWSLTSFAEFELSFLGEFQQARENIKKVFFH